MKYQIVECSDKAKAKIKSYDDTKGVETDVYHNTKYPLRSLKIGQSFAVLYEEVTEQALRSVVSSRGAMLGKKFTLIKHESLKLYEVARIA